MSELKKRLQACDRNTLLAHTVSLIDSEVASKTGVSGAAIKTGYNVVKRLRHGTMLHHASDILLDQFTDALSPFYDSFLHSSDPSFEAFLSTRQNDVANALLSVTDHLAEQKNSNLALTKTYSALRKHALKHVVLAVPRLSQMIDQYAPKS